MRKIEEEFKEFEGIDDFCLKNEEGECNVAIRDNLVKLIGPFSVIGRSLVLFSGEDDFGKGGHALSLLNGNKGRSIAAGVLGIATD